MSLDLDEFQTFLDQNRFGEAEIFLQSKFLKNTLILPKPPSVPPIEEPAINTKQNKFWLTSEMTVDLLNILYRKIRRARYYYFVERHPATPTIISEGDSWFQYPLMLNDIIDYLMIKYPIYSVDAAGNTLSNIISQRNYKDLIDQNDSQIFLLSAGGNDILNDGSFDHYLTLNSSSIEKIEDKLMLGIVDQQLTNFKANYKFLISDILNLSPDMQIFIHGYDYIRPRKDGNWIGQFLLKRQISLQQGRHIVIYLVDRFNDVLKDLEIEFNGSVSYIDLRGSIDRGSQSWYDELHPKSTGFARAAARFDFRISAHSKRK